MNQPQQNPQQAELFCIFLIDSQINHGVIVTFKKNQVESTFVETINAKKANIAVGWIYKHPNMDVKEFNNHLNQMLEKVTKEQKQLILLGDFNINLLN